MLGVVYTTAVVCEKLIIFHCEVKKLMPIYSFANAVSEKIFHILEGILDTLGEIVIL
jgi:hypothetical protein